MKTPLFLDEQARLSFDKLAMAIKLSDNADNWQQEISAEIYKHLPYLSDYAVNVLLERVNPERGYAFGSAQVTNVTEKPNPAGPAVTIPLLVKDRMLQPLDVMFREGKAYPLSEDRLREALFDGRTFETSQRKPVDQGMVDQLYPPIRTNYGYGSGVTTGAAAGGAGFGKFASLCQAIAPTVSEEAVENMVNQIMGDEQLKVAAQHNPAYGELVLALANAERQPLQKTAQGMIQSIRPTTVQFTKLADGNFQIKWANAGAFAPQATTASPGQAQEMAGTDAVQGMQPGQSMTVSTDQAQDDPQAPTPAPAGHFGQYRVMDIDSNQERTGWVLPVIDFSGSEIPMFLFTDGDGYSLQDEVVGIHVGDDAQGMPVGDQPQGDGAFVMHKSDGSAVATLPVTIKNSSQDPDGNVSYMAEDAFGEQLQLTVSEGLQSPQEFGEGQYALPASMQWMPLGQAIHLAKTSGDTEQVKEARALPNMGFLRCTGDGEYHLDGIPFSKLASDQRHWLGANDAEFLMVSAGMNQFQVREKLAQVHREGYTELRGLRTITPLSEVHEQAVKEASALLKDFPYELQRNLIKEAAALEDSETADKILAMNFLNPENVKIFAGYLPQLDEAAQKLAEMLMAARMGMSQIDEGALERSMANLEEVIKGLRALQQKQLL